MIGCEHWLNQKTDDWFPLHSTVKKCAQNIQNKTSFGVPPIYYATQLGGGLGVNHHAALAPKHNFDFLSLAHVQSVKAEGEGFILHSHRGVIRMF